MTATASCLRQPGGEHIGQTAVNRVIGRLGRHYRQRRMALFLDALAPGSDTRILDVGGTVAFWASSRVTSPIVVLNPAPWAAGDGPPNIAFVQADGTATGYGDRAFDIVFSNSVIEHLGTIDEQRKMACEIRRIGRSYWVQTPARRFPFDGHLIAPFVHWLPRRLRRHVAPITPYALLRHASPAQARAMVDQIRLLSAGEVRDLFPDATLLREKAFGLTKSYIAVRQEKEGP